MIKTIIFKKATYPAFQAEGNASRFAIPFAQEVCEGVGLDIGYCKEEWKLPGAIGIDAADDSPYDAMNLPDGEVDYIYSSHCLEHLDDWVAALDLWRSKIKQGGTLFLYLPHFKQKYWRPWHCKKHRHVLTPEIIKQYLYDSGEEKYFVSEMDLNNSFMVMVEVGYRDNGFVLD